MNGIRLLLALVAIAVSGCDGKYTQPVHVAYHAAGKSGVCVGYHVVTVSMPYGVTESVMEEIRRQVILNNPDAGFTNVIISNLIPLK